MHGLGATAGFVLFRVDGEGWETMGGWERRPGLGAMGGGEGLVVPGSLGLGANGGFFTPVLMTPDLLLSPFVNFQWNCEKN